ncbi:enoyl-CoA hydratase [Variovorax defluvii]|uniref:Enoyl-CoA hydratase n=1 Tax=Variovorax defluvii TaxID=913761 RepID=A0ABP8IH15_9BURK
MSGRIVAEVRGPVGRLTVANPDRYNAMSLPMWRMLREAVLHLEHDPEVRVLVLTGEGDRAFVSGADISGFATDRDGAAASEAYDEAVRAAQSALVACVKPTVARIAGVCMGGGIGLALSCDLRYARSTARFRMPAARLGLGYSYTGMEQLVQAVGAACALDLFLTARAFDGAEAQRVGVVHECFADDAFDRGVAERIGALAANAPLTLRAAKAAIRDIVQPAGPARRAEVEAWVRACFDSADYREGQLAFREKRNPKFAGC